MTAYSLQEVFEMLRKAGLHEAAEAALQELPDPVELEHVQYWGGQRGITRDDLVSWNGGSP